MIITEENKEEAITLIKFMIIGVSGIIVNYIALYIFLLVFDISIAVAIAIVCSMTSNYIFNRIWTFKSHGTILKEYFSYLLSASLGSLVQYVITILLTKYLIASGIENLNFIRFDIPIVYISSLVGIGFGFILNFLISKKFVFNDE